MDDDRNPSAAVLFAAGCITCLLFATTLICWPGMLTLARYKSQDCRRFKKLGHTLRVGYIEEGVTLLFLAEVAYVNNWPLVLSLGVATLMHLAFGYAKLDEEAIFATWL